MLYWPLRTDQVFLTNGRCMALGPKKMDDCRATFNGTNGTWLVLVPSILFFSTCEFYTSVTGKWQMADDNQTTDSDGQMRLWWGAVGPTGHYISEYLGLYLADYPVIYEDWNIMLPHAERQIPLATSNQYLLKISQLEPYGGQSQDLKC